MAEIVKTLKGHSGSEVYLMQQGKTYFVRKIGNVERNFERLTELYRESYPVPRIIEKNNQILDMEYIHGLDMKSYLINYDLNFLSEFIIDILDKFAKKSVPKNYLDIYNEKLAFVDQATDLPFSKKQLIQKLPTELPSSQYHGDLTLENILYSNHQFYMIDAVTTEYDSYIFDIAKLRQDVDSKWFLRESNISLDVKLKILENRIAKKFSEAINDNILILMLLRVYTHTLPNDGNRKFILKEIQRLWK